MISPYVCFLFLNSLQLTASWSLWNWKIPYFNDVEIPDVHDVKEAIFNNILATLDPYNKLPPDQVAVYHDLYTSLDLNAIDPEAFMEVNEIIHYHGYPVQQHNLTTADGYFISIQRIPHGKNGPDVNITRKPVLIQHGLLSSSAAWVSNTADKNLPYLLADAGYDVWLGNVRGTLFGRKHAFFSPTDEEFWNYSFDEIAKYDIPAIIDTILNVTGYNQIYYVGHSMGTTVMFALLSSQPKYNEIIKGMFAMAPVAYVGNIRSPVRYLAYITPGIRWILQWLGKGEFLSNQYVVKLGYDEAQMNATRLPVFLHHTPAATSVQNVVHLAQMVRSHKFQFHDFGYYENINRYKQSTPPEYNISKITTPVVLFWSDNDYLADPTDVSKLALRLQNIVLKYRVPYDNFSHLDFVWSLDIKPLLYNKLLETMQKIWKD
uniref:Lipase n=1 Tax=Strigamia maritima TaxID=126957 RepID=T1JNG7_STRMM